MSTEDRLKAVFEDVMPGELIPVHERTRFNTPAWDSLCQLTLLVAVEEEFCVVLSDEDARDLLSFNVALEVVKGLIGETEP